VAASKSAAFASKSSREAPEQADYKTFWFTQTVDHFNFAVQQTFSQRYLVSDKTWNGNGPILFYTGNEGDITMFWENTGFVTEFLPSKVFPSCLVVFAEHRYYGQSLPFGSNSFNSTTNLSYLTSEQALADYAVLIDYIKTTQYPNAQSSPVIAFGGSYGGMLSAWFRLKYPHVVVGAIAASAPILQFYNTGVSQWVFSQITTDDFTASSPTCSSTIRSAFNQILEASYNTLTAKFHLCSPLQSENDVYNLIGWITGGIQFMAMIDYPYPTNFLEPVPAWPVAEACNAIQATLNQGGDDIDALVSGLGIYYNYTGSSPCYNTTSTATNDLGTTGWDYQACTEMVMPIGSNGTSDMFLPGPFDLEAFITSCQQQFGVTPRPNWIITHYGGNLLPSNTTNIVGSNIVFSNGNLDPWHGGGVLTSLSDSLVAVLIEGGAHHLDLRTPDPANDPPGVVVARKIEIANMWQWIQQHEKELKKQKH